jgi:hypothetical protein
MEKMASFHQILAEFHLKRTYVLRISKNFNMAYSKYNENDLDNLLKGIEAMDICKEKEGGGVQLTDGQAGEQDGGPDGAAKDEKVTIKVLLAYTAKALYIS